MKATSAPDVGGALIGGTFSQGTRTDLDEPLSNGKMLAGGGNTGAYLLRRLARSHPATLAASSLTADAIVERLVQCHGLDEVIAFPKRSIDWLAQQLPRRLLNSRSVAATRAFIWDPALADRSPILARRPGLGIPPKCRSATGESVTDILLC